MDKLKSEKITYIKILVTFLVVIAHSTRMYTGYGAINGYEVNEVLKFITEFIYGFHMPLFIALSGFVFAMCIDMNKYKDNKKFIINKIKRLLVPYFLFGFLYVAPVMVVLNITNDSYFMYCLKGIILGQNSRHLWFLTTLFLIFMVSIFLRPRNLKSSLLTIGICGILLVLSKFVHISIISNFFGYIIFFYIGYFLSMLYRMYDNKKAKMAITISLTIVYCICFMFDIPETILKLIGVFFGFFILLCLPIVKNKLFNIFKEYSMGIYLFHPMIIYVLYYLLIDFNFNPYIQSITIAIISIIISMIFTYILKKLNLNFVLGEK